jgi:small subunit ribosomal protein S1
MTNPEAPQNPTPAAESTPPQSPATAEPARVAEEQSAAPPAPAPATAEASAEGGESAGESGGDEHDEAGDAGEGESTTEGGGEGATAAAGPAGEKKRRRRRRKKKPGAHAGEAGSEAGAVGAPGDPTPEGAIEETAATAEGAPAGEARREGRPPKKDAKDKREKKHGPPRERPPVNGGDIVFGKILEITDEAILIDIPGKAKAIFDRAEMLLPDDEDERGKPVREKRPVPAEEPAAEGEGAAQAEGEAAVEAEAEAEVEAAEEAEATESPAVVPEVEVPAAEAAVEAAPVEAAAEVPAAEVAGEAAPAAEPAPEAPKEPKVPRVILEVGADFIGVVHNDGARGGLVVLTHHPRRADKSRVAVEKAFNDKTTVMGLVTGVIKGGIEVDVDGLRAFAPGSHVELRLGGDLSHLVAKRLPFFVTQYAKRGRDLVLSRRAMLEEEAKKTRAEVLSKLKVGEEIEGIVRSVVPFGAFVDVGGVEGLVPLQEMSHNRADGPNDVFKAGEPTKVKVTKIDERGKIWLSHKATIPDPWSEVASKYAQGTKHTGTVARLQPFGVFVELEPGIDGLIHLADLSLTRIESPSEVVKVGDPIDVVVSHVEPGTHRIALHPALKGDAANEAPQKIQPHKPVKAKVVTIETGGLVVRILGVTGRNARGYVTAAGTGTLRGTELRKVFKPGQEIEGKVLEIDPRRGEIKLSIKALGEDNERNAYQQYRQQLKAEAKFTFGDLLNKTTPKR